MLDANLPTTGHEAADLVVYGLMLALALIRGIEGLQRWGLLPGGERGVGKSVGKLHVESLKSMIREEVEPVTDRMDEMNVNLVRMITILEERRH